MGPWASDPTPAKNHLLPLVMLEQGVRWHMGSVWPLRIATYLLQRHLLRASPRCPALEGKRDPPCCLSITHRI